LRAEEELREILGHLKGFLLIHRDMGFDPPPIRAELLRPAEAEPASSGVKSRLAHLESLEALRGFLGDCRRCRLHEGRKHLVFGEGNPRAKLLFVGEGPGHEEDLAGKPFVGEAGRLLTKIIENGMGLTREEVYICNVVKCRPPGNRDPQPDEIETCAPFLIRQIEIIRPEVICSLGRIAGQALLGSDFKITRDRGRMHSFQGIPMMPTYHPAYLLRNPSAKRQVWEDVKKIMGHLGLEVKKNA